MSGVLGQKFKEIDDAKLWIKLFDQIKAESANEDCKLTLTLAKLPQNQNLTRYPNVLPYDHSIVKLSTGAFINANYLVLKEVGRYFILTQGPLPITVHTFWLMIWEHEVKCIVMLNRIFEQSKMKCYMYFPGKEIGPQGVIAPTSLTFGEFQIDLKQEEHRTFYSIRTFILRNKNTNTDREVQQYQYNAWPDFGVPSTTNEFLEFLSEIRRTNLLNCGINGPMVCHCSAGIGRSGTFVIADAALVLAQKMKDPAKIDLKHMVIEYRKSRMGLIQTPEQLRFAWKAVIDALDNEKWKSLLTNTCCEDDPNSGRGKKESSNRSSRRKKSEGHDSDDRSLRSSREIHE